MKCHEAVKLMDKYIEDTLDKYISSQFEEHIRTCKACKTELAITRSLHKERSIYNKIKAPEGFTGKVMASIYNLEPQKRPLPSGKNEEMWRSVYRRLGFSLILTAGVLIFSLLIPTVNNYPSAISGNTQSGSAVGESSGLRGVFTDIDYGIRGVFKSINNSMTDFKGGTGNEM